MRPLGAQQLLDVADQAKGLSWIDRGLLLARCASGGALAGHCEDLPIGVRDRLILALRIETFGPILPVQSRCAVCGEQLEAQVDGAAMLARHLEEPPATIPLQIDGSDIELRMPTSRDLHAVAGLPHGQAQWGLVRRCLGSGVEPNESARTAAAEALAEADPFSSVELELICAACGNGSVVNLDLVTFVLAEIETAAHRIAAQVHRLARAYGWTESEILKLPEARRRRYLQLVAEGSQW